MSSETRSPRSKQQYESRGELITVDPGSNVALDAEALPVYE